VIELKEKESRPYGEVGRDAFGKVPMIEDRGKRKRAIIALGKQDVEIESLIPLDKGVKILGGSSDHIILDVQESEVDYRVGSQMEFVPLYPSLLKLMGSSDVRKIYV
jgi:predicted amino acid racemase